MDAVADEPQRFLGLSPAQIAAGALAAVTSALAASYLGVAGTVIGAAVGSVVSTVGAALYATSLERAGQITSTRLRLVRSAPGAAALDDPTALPPELDRHVRVLADAQAGTAAPGPAARRPAEPRPTSRRPGLKLLAGIAGVFFVIAIGLISLTELALGHPVADSTGGGTTISRTITGNKAPARTTPTPSTTPSPSDAPSSSPAQESPSAVPAQSPSDQPAPSDAPSGQGVPSPASSVAPTDQPAPSAPATGQAQQPAPAAS